MSVVEVRAMDIEEPDWIPDIRGFAAEVLEEIGAADWELSLIFCSDTFIRDLNKEYRNLDEPTDVLSFPMGERLGTGRGSTYLAGDVVISPQACKRNCADFHVDFPEELRRLVIHGILHLSGMDHEDNDPERPMLKRQEEILTLLVERRAK
ncbi:MAG TPA: rRNA maturation RNase YbeY [Rectinemataceae bacterium]